jgi:hypothetical protein
MTGGERQYRSITLPHGRRVAGVVINHEWTDSTAANTQGGVSMTTSNEYRKMAEECYRLASEAKTETDRLACLELARNWLEAASSQDRMSPEQIAEAEKLTLAWDPKRDFLEPKTALGWRQRLLSFFR